MFARQRKACDVMVELGFVQNCCIMLATLVVGMAVLALFICASVQSAFFIYERQDLLMAFKAFLAGQSFARIVAFHAVRGL
ncbi:MAG: hypothetical protein AB7N80_05685 [Bdellovibrionales bacterium]